VRRSQAIAWWFAGGCLVVAATSVAALAMIAPLKEVRPYVVIVVSGACGPREFSLTA